MRTTTNTRDRHRAGLLAIGALQLAYLSGCTSSGRADPLPPVSAEEIEFEETRTRARMGDPHAQYEMAVTYLDGLGVAPHEEYAVGWCRRAALQGHPEAQGLYGLMYLNGVGVSQDYERAVRWLRLAAEAGVPDAQQALGQMYAQGIGVPLDDVEAERWLARATAQTQGALPAWRGPDLDLNRMLELGDHAFRAGHYSIAAKRYRQAVERVPGDGVLHLILADALFATGDYADGATALRWSLQIEPSLLAGVFDKRKSYGRPADFGAHLAAAESWIAAHPGDDDARLLLAANYLFGGDPEACIEFLLKDANRRTVESPAGRAVLAGAQAQRN